MWGNLRPKGSVLVPTQRQSQAGIMQKWVRGTVSHRERGLHPEEQNADMGLTPGGSQGWLQRVIKKKLAWKVWIGVAI